MPPPTIPLRPLKDLKGAIARQAEHFSSARGSRMTLARAKALLMRLGTEGAMREDDLLDISDEPWRHFDGWSRRQTPHVGRTHHGLGGA